MRKKFCLLASYVITLGSVIAQNGEPLVGDMHYHLSMKAHNLHEPELFGATRACGLKNRYGSKLTRPGSRQQNNNLNRYTQATLPHSVKGNVRLAFNAISPFEHNLAKTWGDRIVHKFFKSGAKMTWLDSIGSKDWITLTHFDNFLKEYFQVIRYGEKHPGSWTYWMGTENTMDPSRLYVLNVLESSHALQGDIFRPSYDYLDPDQIDAESQHVKFEEIKKELSDNIKKVKELPKPVFMMTIAHLGYNGMVGQALALDGTGVARLVAGRFFRSRVSHSKEILKQWNDKFFSPPMPTPLGLHMIDNLLSTGNGHRIFVDLKHSSYPTRDWFYKNYSTDSIPPICSHCAVNGLSKIHYSVTTDEYAYARAKEIKNFYPFSINLFDEEINEYYKNGGIIGLTLEERILGGYMNTKRMKETNRDLRMQEKNGLLDNIKLGIRKDLDESNDKKAYKIFLEDYFSLEPFLYNLFYVLDHAKGYDTLGNLRPFKDKSERDRAWSMICLGSDMDGIIDPIDIIPTASQFPYFFARLKESIPIFLRLRNKRLDSYFEKTGDSFEIDIDRKLRRVFYENLSLFVVKNFRRK